MKHQGVMPDIIDDNRKGMLSTENGQFPSSYPERRWLEQVITEKRKADCRCTGREGNPVLQNGSVAHVCGLQDQESQQCKKTGQRSNVAVHAKTNGYSRTICKQRTPVPKGQQE